TGLFYSWPRPGRWLKSLRVNWRVPKRLILRQIHRSAALLTFLLFGLSALTGTYLAVALYVEGGDAVPKITMPVERVAVEAMDRAMAVARTEFPSRGIRDIRISPSALQVYFWAPERNPRAVHFVQIDLSSSRITAERLEREDPDLWVFPLPIHT